MRLHTSPSSYVITPDHHQVGKSLYINRETNEYSVNEIPYNNNEINKISQYIYGIVGIIKLLRCNYLCVITKVTIVAKILGSTIYNINEVKILPFSNKKETSDIPSILIEDEHIYLKMLNKILNNNTLYFSYDYDLTHTSQRIATLNMDEPIWKRADQRFFYNYFLVQPLIDNNLNDWILPIVSGFVISDQFKIKDCPSSFILISRRSWKRTGFRYTCRGLDTSGNAVNYAETEQIVILPETNKIKKVRYLSYVQTRGSIPLLWNQLPNLKYTPSINVGDLSLSHEGYKKHFSEQEKYYGRNVLINLINQKGGEGRLEQAFRKQVETAGLPNVRYIAYDFHHECKGMKYENLNKLVDSVADEFAALNYFYAEYVPVDGAPKTPNTTPAYQVTVLRQQTGVFRTNCIDCLDRTNVVQNVIAEKVLENQLIALGLISNADLEEFAKVRDAPEVKSSGGILSALMFWKKKPAKVNPVTLTLLYKLNGVFAWTYKGIWADNADRMSMLYSGTGALKTDYTRKGKRTNAGAIQDGLNSLTRYYLNNFEDGENQDALDLLPDRTGPSPLKIVAAQESLSWFTFRVAVVLGLAFVAWSWLGPAQFVPASNTSLFGLFMITQVVVSYLLLSRSGRSFVNKPRFVRDDTAAKK